MGVLRFDYSTTNTIHSKQLCLTAKVFPFNVVGALIFMLGRSYWLKITSCPIEISYKAGLKYVEDWFALFLLNWNFKEILIAAEIILHTYGLSQLIQKSKPWGQALPCDF